MNTKTSIYISGALILSSFILAYGMTQIRKNSNFVTVKGLSEREVEADQAWWSINTQVAANTTSEMQERIGYIEREIKAFLKQQGFTNGEINSPSLNVYQNNYQNATARLTGDYKISINSDDIDKVIDAAKETGDLIEKGIFLQSDQWSAGPKYYFTKFKALKKDMLAEATVEAKAAAGEFANNSGSKVGKIRRANQGIFQILPRNNAQENEVFFPAKIVRVVSTVDYYLE